MAVHKQDKKAAQIKALLDESHKYLGRDAEDPLDDIIRGLGLVFEAVILWRGIAPPPGYERPDVTEILESREKLSHPHPEPSPRHN